MIIFLIKILIIISIINQMKQINTFLNPRIRRVEEFLLYHKKNRPRNIVFKGGLFLNMYNHKGQGKISSYTQCLSVFVNPSKPLFIRVTAYWINLFYRVIIVIFINNIVFLQFLQCKKVRYCNIMDNEIAASLRSSQLQK